MRILTGAASWTDPRCWPAAAIRRPCRQRRGPAAPTRRASRWSRSIPATTLPTAENAWRWDQRTPDGLSSTSRRSGCSPATPLSALPADIRASSTVGRAVHNDVPGELRDELWRRYTLALEPLPPGKLGAVHFQFPPWIRRDARPRGAGRAARRMDEHLISIELRHRSWFDSPAATAGTLALLRDLGAVHTVVDAPAGRRTACPPSGHARIQS